MTLPVEEDPDYHPAPIQHLNPRMMGFKQLQKHIDMLSKEVKELDEIREKGTAKDYTKVRYKRKEELEDKIAKFEIEREERLEKRREKRDVQREKDIEEKGDPKSQGQLKSPWDQTKPKKGTYPFVGSAGPGDLNVEEDWEGPIELFEFEDEEEGWLNCTTGYYWHPVLGGGIYQHEGEWYRNWEFDHKPPEEEIVPDEPCDSQQEELKILPDPPKGGTTSQQVGGAGRRKPTTP